MGAATPPIHESLIRQVLSSHALHLVVLTRQAEKGMFGHALPTSFAMLG